MNMKKLLPYLLTFLLAGCVPVLSLHPLYSQQDVIFEEKLLGSWADSNDNSTWQFSRQPKAQNTYHLRYTQKEDEQVQIGTFETHLLRLGDQLFMDFFPADLIWEPRDPNEAPALNIFFVIPGHAFARVDAIEPKLRVRLLMDEDLSKFLKDNPNAVPYLEETSENRIVLTGSTEQLQEFLLANADDPGLFTNEIVLIRKTPEAGDTNQQAPESKPEEEREEGEK